MKPRQTSEMAERCAMQRARHHVYGDDPKVFDDPYAISLISPRFRSSIENRLISAIVWGIFYRWARRDGLALVRSRHAEERLGAALEAGITQYVILGAGLDTFALRRPDLQASLTVFEIDHPDTQQWKQSRLAEQEMVKPGNLVYVPVDFERDSIVQALAASWFSRQAPSFFSWLGTTYYLTKDAVFQTFRATASIAANGSEIVFDYMDEVPFLEQPRSKALERTFTFALAVESR